MVQKGNHTGEKKSAPMSAPEAQAYARSFSPDKGPFLFPRTETVNLMPNSRALVLSPHPDDEVFGCGGTICKFSRTGTHFKVVYLTDGRYGNDSIPMEELIDIRKKEAKNGLKILGCTDAVFLDNPDLGLRCDDTTLSALESVFDDFNPGMIFLPPFDDFHPDHSTASRLAARILKSHRSGIECYFYEVMMPVVPNTLVDITEVMDLKVKAIRQHKSQVDVVDYAEKIKGLNSFRSIYAEKHVRYCEAFLKCSRDSFITLAESMGVLL